MSLYFYTEKEEYSKEESVNNYKDLFKDYIDNPPTLSDALNEIFINSGVTEDKLQDLIGDIISKTEKVIDKNLKEIKSKYPKVSLEDAKIISSYTCESKDKRYSPYKILNKNLVSDNREQGLRNISKYLFILLKSLRKLDKYYPNEKEKYLYRCIRSKVNINYDIFNKKLEPYITGKTKTFWGFTSTSPDIKMTYNFLNGEENNKCGTIFTLAGKIWGYDITLFNYFNEKEILLEPERKFIIDEVIPPINEIIHIRCDMQDNPLILSDNLKIQSITIRNSNNDINFDYLLKYIIIGDGNVGKSDILKRFVHGQFKPEYETTIGCEFASKNIEINKKIYRLQIWDTSGQESYRSITRAYYKNSVCAIIVYNIYDRKSFEDILSWIEDVKDMAPKTITKILVGHNIKSENKREVSYNEGKDFADKYEMLFFEASSITGENIDNIFYESAKLIDKKIEEGYYDLENDQCGIRKNYQIKSYQVDEKGKSCIII